MGIGRQKATVKCLKPFYTFKAFNELYQMKDAKLAECDADNIYTCAASDGQRVAVIAANYNNEDTELTFDLAGIPAGETIEVRLVDESTTFETVMTLEGNENVKLVLPVKNNSFVYIGSAVK